MDKEKYEIGTKKNYSRQLMVCKTRANNSIAGTNGYQSNKLNKLERVRILDKGYLKMANSASAPRIHN